MATKQQRQEQSQREAQAAYGQNHATACDSLVSIKYLLESMDVPSENTNWGHVSEMEEIRKRLLDVETFLRRGSTSWQATNAALAGRSYFGTSTGCH